MKTDLLKEAIADADAIKKLAIENAKASLNEAFDSKIKSMLAAKLQEADDEDSYDEGKDYEETEEPKKPKETEEEEEEPTDESFDLDEILAEMEGEEDHDDEDDEKGEEEGDMEEAKKEEETEEEGEEEGDEDMDEELDLEALLAEISDSEADYSNLEEEEEETDEAYEAKEGELDEAGGDATAKFMATLKKAMKAFETAETPEAPKAEAPKKEAPKAESQELQEIKRQAKQLAQKVNETNLINAKLLYLNKILHNNNLNEGQKVKVLSAFDRATSVKEAKIVYESLSEAFSVKTTKTKNNLKESFGFASKAAGTSTKRDIITEADQQVNRWQKLAGIIK